jgi:hypothetical protein
LNLPWLPAEFGEQLLRATNALSNTIADYQQRVTILRDCFNQLVVRCQQDGLYGENPINEAFIRQHDEPGRDWNMDEWNQEHQGRNK